MAELIRNDLFEKDPLVAGAPKWRVAVWYLVSWLFFRGYACPFSTPKTWLLRLFGAQIGKGLVIKPCVEIKFPWKLQLGDHVWIGEKVWIDNLGQVAIGSHVTLSQGAMLLTGNHDYKKKVSTLFPLRLSYKRAYGLGQRR